MSYRNYRPLRSSKSQRTNEQSRRLKVDVSKIHEWESECNDIIDKFRQNYPLRRTGEAWRVIVDALPEDDGRVDRYKNDIDAWLACVDADSLYSYSGMSILKGWVDRSGLDKKVREDLRRIQAILEEVKTKGTIRSGWNRLFSGKFDSAVVSEWQKEEQRLLRAVPKLLNVAKANAYLDLVSASHSDASAKYNDIRNKLFRAYEKRAAILEFEKKSGQYIAKAASVDQNTRQRAGGLKGVVTRTKECPYCSENLGKDAHLDHIYPVKMGGLSVIENLVWCCAPCNQRKSGKGLLLFLREQNLSADEVINRLHQLGKHV